MHQPLRSRQKPNIQIARQYNIMRTKLMVGLEMLVLRNPVNPVNAEQHQNLFQIVQLAQSDQG